ncbi:hypothetical protein [Bradyrhizobium embrapense]
MLPTKEQSNAIRTLRGWAIGVLRERVPSTKARAKDRATRARERAFDLAFQHKPGVSASEFREVLEDIGDTCPECPEGDCTTELDAASFA